MIRLRLRERKHVAKWCQGPRLRIGGLSVWSRVSSGGYNVMSYHSPKSITWRWLWYVKIARSERTKFFMLHKWIKRNGGVTLHIGPFSTGIHWQPPMSKEPTNDR